MPEYTKEQLAYFEQQKQARRKKIEEAFAHSGRVLVTNGVFRGYVTLSDYDEFDNCNPRDRRRVATNILRRASPEYAGENDSVEGRKLRDVIAFRGKTAWNEIVVPFPIRQQSQVASTETVENRLRRHWLTTAGHKESLLGIELEFATEERYEEQEIEFGKGVCDNGPSCCPPIGPTVKKKVKKLLPKAVYRDIENIIPGVKMKTDGSVQPCYADSAEANLLSGPNGYKRLSRLCEEIKSRGGSVNKTCGLHVHLDARNDLKRIVGIRASKLWDFVEIMKDLVPQARLDNRYCRFEEPSFESARYQAINLAAYSKFKTIEVRAAAGSLNAPKIWHWANLLLAVSNYNKRLKTWEDLLRSGIDLNLKVWAVRRADELRPNKPKMIERINTIMPGLNDVLAVHYGEKEEE